MTTGRRLTISTGRGAIDTTLRSFEKRLLDALGYGPTFDRTADGGEPVHPDRCYRYVPDRGPVATEGGGDPVDGPMVSGRTLLALAGGRPIPQGEHEREDARRLMRAILAPPPRSPSPRQPQALPATRARGDARHGDSTLSNDQSATRCVHPILLGVNVDHVANAAAGARYPLSRPGRGRIRRGGRRCGPHHRPSTRGSPPHPGARHRTAPIDPSPRG